MRFSENLTFYMLIVFALSYGEDELGISRTTLLVAHRRSTLALADRIALLDRGLVVDVGTEAELTVRSPLFRALFTTKSSGMGMGLSIVRSIVEAHGGSIGVRNHASGGAIFEFTLQRAIIRPVA